MKNDLVGSYLKQDGHSLKVTTSVSIGILQEDFIFSILAYKNVINGRFGLVGFTFRCAVVINGTVSKVDRFSFLETDGFNRAIRVYGAVGITSKGH
jgi:hypothetical protein